MNNLTQNEITEGVAKFVRDAGGGEKLAFNMTKALRVGQLCVDRAILEQKIAIINHDIHCASNEEFKP